MNRKRPFRESPSCLLLSKEDLTEVEIKLLVQDLLKQDLAFLAGDEVNRRVFQQAEEPRKTRLALEEHRHYLATSEYRSYDEPRLDTYLCCLALRRPCRKGVEIPPSVSTRLDAQMVRYSRLLGLTPTATNGFTVSREVFPAYPFGLNQESLRGVGVLVLG